MCIRNRETPLFGRVLVLVLVYQFVSLLRSLACFSLFGVSFSTCTHKRSPECFSPIHAIQRILQDNEFSSCKAGNPFNIFNESRATKHPFAIPSPLGPPRPSIGTADGLAHPMSHVTALRNSRKEIPPCSPTWPTARSKAALGLRTRAEKLNCPGGSQKNDPKRREPSQIAPELHLL